MDNADLQNVDKKIVETVLNERLVALTMWGNEFDDANEPEHWLAYAKKQIYFHKDVSGKEIVLTPDRKADLPFMLAMVKVAQIILAAIDAKGRKQSPARPDDNPLELNMKILRKTVDAYRVDARKHPDDLCAWMLDIDEKIANRAQWQQAATMQFMLANVLCEIKSIEAAVPGLLDQALVVGRERMKGARPYFEPREALVPNA